MTDKQLLENIALGNEEALVALQQNYESYCYRIAFSILRDAQSAAECIDDVWMSIWSSREKPVDLKAYIAKTTRNAAIAYLRKSSAEKRNARMVLLDELAECIPDFRRSEEVERYLLRDTLNDFLADLKQEERFVFLGRYWYGYTNAEIAKELRWRETKVRCMLFRLRKKLKLLLLREGFFV